MALSSLLHVAGVAALAAGATITKGTTQAVSIQTLGAPGAQCTLTSGAIGTQTLVTPATLTLEKSQENIQVVCREECYQDAFAIIPSHTEGMTAGNILVGGVVDLGVDTVSGAMSKYNDNNQFAMVPIAGCKSRV
ncbi:MAG: hypothetical protein AB1749_15625 [Pseudomonadota bacterium]